MCENLSGIVVARGVGERQEGILGCDRGAREGRTSVDSESRVVNRGGLRAVQGVKHDGRARNRVVGVNRAGIQHRDGGGGVPDEGVGRVRVLREPALDGLDLA